MKRLLLISFTLAIAAAVQAQIIHVPADYPTIQQGIDVAIEGDTILVSDGIYFEQINFLGKKPLLVSSQFIIDGDTNHIANTIIDGSQLPDINNASVVYFVSDEDTTSVLCGFTIRDGKGTYTPDNFNDRQGGGIWISNAGAKIIHNRITHNTVDDTQSGTGESTAGGGIAVRYDPGDYWIVIANNTIDSNTCISSYDYAWGGGIATSYNTRITNNIITHNSCIGHENSEAIGGGIACGQNQGWPDVVMIIHQNTITGNIIQTDNNNAISAGIYCLRVQSVFTNNLVADNTVNFSYAGGVGGLYYLWPDPESVVRGNIFYGNDGFEIGGALVIQNTITQVNEVLVENNYFIDNVASSGGGLAVLSNTILLQNNVFIGNSALEGGAVYLSNESLPSINHLVHFINNSFSGNTAVNNGGAIYSDLARPLIFNSILWNDDAGGGKEIFLTSADDIVEIANSLINPGLIAGNFYDGGGNIDEDPQFDDPELLTLSNSSPCINAGTASYVCQCNELLYAPVYDINGTNRPLNEYYDMGAYEVLVTDVAKPLDFETGGLNIFPNPASDRITAYTSAISASANLSIFTVSGEKAVERQLTDTETQLDISALPRGVYFVRVQDEKIVEVVKMIKQ